MNFINPRLVQLLPVSEQRSMLAVLNTIRSRCNAHAEGKCFLSRSQLAAMHHCDKRTIIRHVQALQRCKLLEEVPNARGTFGHRGNRRVLRALELTPQAVARQKSGDTGVTSPGDTGVTSPRPVLNGTRAPARALGTEKKNSNQEAPGGADGWRDNSSTKTRKLATPEERRAVTNTAEKECERCGVFEHRRDEVHKLAAQLVDHLGPRQATTKLVWMARTIIQSGRANRGQRYIGALVSMVAKLEEKRGAPIR